MNHYDSWCFINMRKKSCLILHAAFNLKTNSNSNFSIYQAAVIYEISSYEMFHMCPWIRYNFKGRDRLGNRVELDCITENNFRISLISIRRYYGVKSLSKSLCIKKEIMIMISYNVLQKRLISQKYKKNSPGKYALLLYYSDFYNVWHRFFNFSRQDISSESF